MSNETEAERVGRRTRRGIGWNLIGSGLTNVVKLAVVALLGRLLSSADFGVVAAAMTVIQVLNTFRDVGLGQAIVQRKDLTPAHEATAFATSVYLGVGIALLIVITAPSIGEVYNIPESVPVLRALGVLFALRGLSTLSYMMCQRRMNFRAIAIVDTVAYVAGSIASVALAFSGFGAWALVGGYLIESTLNALLYVRLHPPPFTMRIHWQSLRDLLGFGIGSVVMQIASVFAGQGDYFVVGRELGKGELGFYTRAYELVRLPATVFTAIVGNVLFPAFSRLQDDRRALAQSFRRTLFTNAFLLLPVGAALFIVAPEAIRIVLGPGWSEAVLPFRIFSLTLLFRTSYKAGAIVARAAGDVYAVAIAMAIYAVCVIAGAAASVRWGIEGVAVSTSIAIVLAYVMLSYLGMLRTGLSWGAFVNAHVAGALLAAVLAAGGWPLAAWLRSTGAGAPVIAGLLAVITGLVLLAGIAWMPASLHPDVAWLRDEVRRVAARLRRKRQ